MRLQTRVASPADLPQVAALVNSAYRGDSSRRGWTTEADLLGGQRTDAEVLAEQLRVNRAVVLLAEVEGQMAGCVYLQPLAADGGGGAEAYLGMLTIDPETQAQGLGRALLEASERYVRDAFGAQAMRMTVIAQRPELIAWYERRGYVRTGETQPFPYGDERFGLPKVNDLYFVVLRKLL